MFHTNLYFLVTSLVNPILIFAQDNGGKFITVGPPCNFLLLSYLTIKLST